MIEEKTLSEPTLSGVGLTPGIVPGGTALGDFLYPAPAERRVGAILSWWEKRRLPYNLIVGGIGLFTMTVGSLIMAVNGEFTPVAWLRGSVFWLVMLNVSYSLGPIAEIALQKFFRDKLLPSGPLLFRAAVTIAVGVTLLPIIFIALGYLAMSLGIGP
ncbi:hypothetical protein [Candidatus Palauibacter sp.]|uniref:hypothetical protein n=1 Tax=Candidatus Palauibacter sp. TaxID=3101350 RepID=UPI003C700061